MSRLIGAFVLIVAIGAVYYFVTRPDPTPAEQLETAAQEATDATDDAASAIGEAVSDAAQDTTDTATDAASGLGEGASDAAQSVTEQATDTVAALQEQGSEALENAAEAVTDTINNSTAALGEGAAGVQEQGQALLKQLQDQGLLTQENFNYDQIVTMVEASPLAQAVKDSFIAILGEIRDAPEQFDTGLKKLQDLFQS